MVRAVIGSVTHSSELKAPVVFHLTTETVASCYPETISQANDGLDIEGRHKKSQYWWQTVNIRIHQQDA